MHQAKFWIHVSQRAGFLLTEWRAMKATLIPLINASLRALRQLSASGFSSGPHSGEPVALVLVALE